MGFLEKARSLIFITSRAQAVPRGEGEVIAGPVARVSTPEAGWLPMAWPLNFWQTGRNVLSHGDASIVESCCWAYIRAIAQLPGYHRRQLSNGGIETVTTSAVSRLLRFPNSYETRSDFLTHCIRSLLYDGNSYWLALRNERKEVAGLHWLNPRSCRVQVEQSSGEIFYALGENPLIGPEPSGVYGGVWLIPARDVLHIKLATPQHPLIGETWLTALALDLAARGAMSLAQASFFTNMSRPSGVLSTDLVLTATQVQDLRVAWNAQAAGMNAGGVPILTAGLKWQAVGISNHDAQMVEAMKLTDRAVAGVFGVPGFLVGLQEAGPWSSTEALMSYWLAGGLGFLIDHIEVAFDQFFGLPADEFVEFDTDALLRTDFKTRIEGLARGVQTGIFAPDEARAKEGYGATPGGSVPRVQQQQVPLDWTGFDVQPSPPAATPSGGLGEEGPGEGEEGPQEDEGQ